MTKKLTTKQLIALQRIRSTFPVNSAMFWALDFAIKVGIDGMEESTIKNSLTRYRKYAKQERK